MRRPPRTRSRVSVGGPGHGARPAVKHLRPLPHLVEEADARPRGPEPVPDGRGELVEHLVEPGGLLQLGSELDQQGELAVPVAEHVAPDDTLGPRAQRLEGERHADGDDHGLGHHQLVGEEDRRSGDRARIQESDQQRQGTERGRGATGGPDTEGAIVEDPVDERHGDRDQGDVDRHADDDRQRGAVRNAEEDRDPPETEPDHRAQQREAEEPQPLPGLGITEQRPEDEDEDSDHRKQQQARAPGHDPRQSVDVVRVRYPVGKVQPPGRVDGRRPEQQQRDGEQRQPGHAEEPSLPPRLEVAVRERGDRAGPRNGGDGRPRRGRPCS